MKKLVLLFAALLAGAGSTLAGTGIKKMAAHTAFNYGNSFIFVENGITFSVFPDGEFDFYIDNRVSVNAHVGVGPVGITFNSGYDYNPYVQYDDYGAVIQVENVPIYYDYYGRVSHIGGVRMWYRNNLVYRIGGMYIHYNPMGLYAYHTGFINVYNRGYFYRPFHRYFARPVFGFCLVSPHPYRRYYSPVRYTYYGPYRYNTRRTYASIGKTYRYAPRTDRDRIYRNDARVSARSSQYQSDRGMSYRRDAARTAKTETRSNRKGYDSRTQSRSAVRREAPAAQQRKATASRTGSPGARKADPGSQARSSSRNTPVRKANPVASQSQRSRAQAPSRSGQARKSAGSPQLRKATAQNSRRSSGNTKSRSSRSGIE